MTFRDAVFNTNAWHIRHPDGYPLCHRHCRAVYLSYLLEEPKAWQRAAWTPKPGALPLCQTCLDKAREITGRTPGQE